MANAGAVRRSSQSPAITPALNPFFGLLPQALWNNAKDFFGYGVNFVPLAASGTATQAIAIQSDSDFLCCALAGWVTTSADPSALVAVVPFLVNIFDNGSGRSLMNVPLHYHTIIGTAQLPSYLPFPKLIPRASTVDITLQNLVATEYHARISLLGFKIFGGMQ